MTGIPTPNDGRHPLAVFHDNLAVAQMHGPDEDDDSPLPIVETTREVITYLNKGKERLAAFDAAGYMVMNNVIVCEEGKKQDVIERMQKSLDTLVQVPGGSMGGVVKK